MEKSKTGDNTLPKSMRLCGQKAVDQLFRDGHSGFVYPFRYIFSVAETASDAGAGNTVVSGQAEGEAAGRFRVLFSVPKRYHKRANKRNLLKRRSRESFRQAKHGLYGTAGEPGRELRVALIYSSKEIEGYSKIDNAIRKIIRQLQEAV